MEDVKLQEPMSPPMGEWHRSEYNEKVIRHICREAFGGDHLVGIAHHICVYYPDGSIREEIASAETLIFDPRIMGRVFHSATCQVLMELASTRPVDRLAYLGRRLNLGPE